ncbi:unnamed protein product [Cylindrotheca closterium]|uniref:VTT domain-containing protein n=1 Tax=Cylindrotheca closterium TaxID=2856 RepID=A0AAD2FJX6_9STRA|nr:unnamed protein product [Cylindrotheca closterium]
MRTTRTSRLQTLSMLCMLVVTILTSSAVSALHRPSRELPASVMGWRDEEDSTRIPLKSFSDSSSFVTAKKAATDAAPCPRTSPLQVVSRGGGGGGGDVKKNVPAPARNNPKKTTVLVTTTVVACLLWKFREPLGAIFSKDKIQSKTLEILGKLDSLPKLQSYASYVGGMALWELFGLSTIPVETAAGMVFGWNGILLSGSGKLLGAIVAFLLGRYGALAHWIQSKLSSNSFLQDASHSTEDSPLKVAFLMKMSSFPETIKNYGSALLSPIKLWMFVVATFFHGVTFSALWTYLGVDTAARLENTELPADGKLQFLLAAALFNGIVISPLSMAYWVKMMQKSKQQAAAFSSSFQKTKKR